MNAKSDFTGSNLQQVDDHVITPEEYAEIPELTPQFFQQADLYQGETLIRRGRPRSTKLKRSLTVRYDAEVVAAFKATGKGWQTRMNEALREWLRLDSA
jgi:uncharacterized protein (DUF4415 family)